MIVSMNKNPEKYTALFTQANKLLNLEINSLAEYYSHMHDFFAQQKYKFVMLPLDEEPFVIDLNTRSISVPASFIKCASIQNDQLAETIVFVADRYFDYMDLANTEIYVQWTVPADAKNGRPEDIKGATFVEMRDIETEPSKIRFAWPLSKQITQYAGNIKFSVRFFRLDDENKNLVYSLNTSDATLTIKPALQPELTDSIMVDSPISDNAFVGVILNSKYGTEGVDMPLQPSYGAPGSNIILLKKDSNGDWIKEELNIATGVLGNPKIANLQENTLILGVQAVTADAGVLTYDWYHINNVYEKVTGTKPESYNPLYRYYKKVNGIYEPIHVTAGNYETFKADIENDLVYHLTVTKLVDKNDGNTQNYIYVKCNTVEKNIQKKYYTLNIDGTAGYSEVDQNEAGFPNKDIDYYECYNIYEIVDSQASVTGVYYADAWNTIPIQGKEPLITLNATRSDDCLLPGPEDIVFAENGNLPAAAIMNDDGAVSLKVAVVDDVYGAQRSYVWERKFAENEDFVNDIEATENNILADMVGWYRVKVASTFNREDKENTSNVCKVTDFPVPATVKVQNETTVNLNAGDAEFTIELDISEEDKTNKLLTEGYKGIWQIKPGDAKEFVTIADGYVGVTFDTKDFENDTIKVSKALKFNSASFRCLVTNTLNGEVAVFDHLNLGQVDSSIGTFKFEAPYIYTDSEDSFYFSIVKI